MLIVASLLSLVSGLAPPPVYDEDPSYPCIICQSPFADPVRPPSWGGSDDGEACGHPGMCRPRYVFGAFCPEASPYDYPLGVWEHCAYEYCKDRSAAISTYFAEIASCTKVVDTSPGVCGGDWIDCGCEATATAKFYATDESARSAFMACLYYSSVRPTDPVSPSADPLFYLRPND